MLKNKYIILKGFRYKLIKDIIESLGYSEYTILNRRIENSVTKETVVLMFFEDKVKVDFLKPENICLNKRQWREIKVKIGYYNQS